MPIYEYRCASCDETFEVIHKVGDRPLRKCRVCSGKVEKLVSRTAFLLKGGGWFSEGYSADSGKKGSDDSKKKTKAEKKDKAAKSAKESGNAKKKASSA